MRDALVRTRTRYVALIKAAVRREGLRLSQGDVERTALKLSALDLRDEVGTRSGRGRDEVKSELAPLVALLTPLNAEITQADHRIMQLGYGDPVVRRLATAPG